MNRIEAFRSYEDHAWLCKSFKKLTNEELTIAEGFIATHDYLSKVDFEYAINRMFIDRAKPKNWTIIMEMLMNANSRAFPVLPQHQAR